MNILCCTDFVFYFIFLFFFSCFLLLFLYFMFLFFLFFVFFCIFYVFFLFHKMFVTRTIQCVCLLTQRCIAFILIFSSYYRCNIFPGKLRSKQERCKLIFQVKLRQEKINLTTIQNMEQVNV